MKQKLYNLLRWSERYTKTDMVYLTKGGFWLAAGHGIQVVSGLVLAIAFANLLPKTAYGTYQFVMAIAAILSAFTLSGMHVAVKRAVARGNDGALRYGFRTQMIWSSGIVLASGALSLYYFMRGNTVLGEAFLIVGALSPFIEGFSLFKAYLIGTQRFKESAFLGLWRRPLFIVTMLTALFLTDDPVILIFVYFTSSAVSAGLLYALVIRKYALPICPDAELKNYSKHLSVMGLVGTTGNNIDKVLVWTMLGAAPLAAYTLALLPVTHLLKFFGLGGELIFPKFAKHSFNAIRAQISRKVLWYLAVSATIAAVYALTAPHIYRMLFPLYAEAIIPSQLLALVLLIKPATLFGQAFAAQGMRHFQYAAQLSNTISRIALLLLLVPAYGIWGAVWSFILSNTIWAVVVTALFYIAPIANTSTTRANDELNETSTDF